MPRVQATTSAPTFEQARADVRTGGPMTAAYGEVMARRLGVDVSYTARRDRGVHFLRGLVASGKLAEDDLVAAVAQFAADKATTAERAGILPHFDYKHT